MQTEIDRVKKDDSGWGIFTADCLLHTSEMTNYKGDVFFMVPGGDLVAIAIEMLEFPHGMCSLWHACMQRFLFVLVLLVTTLF